MGRCEELIDSRNLSIHMDHGITFRTPEILYKSSSFGYELDNVDQRQTIRNAKSGQLAKAVFYDGVDMEFAVDSGHSICILEYEKLRVQADWIIDGLGGENARI